ncbi:MAG: Protein containing domains DUF403, partial [uncultured Friedmanniella sp.]
AEPDRGVDVLDRALRGTRGGHLTAAADPPPADHRGHLLRNRCLPQPAGPDERRPRRAAHARGPAAGPRLRRQGADLDLRLLGGRPGQRPTSPRGHPAGAVGVHQHHLAPAADRPFPDRAGAHLPGLGAGAQRPVHRHRPRHHGPRRRLGVHDARPLARAGRHDVAAGRVGVAAHRQHPVAVGAARLRRTRRLPAHLPGAADRPRGGAVPDLRRPLPALDHARAVGGLGLPAPAHHGQRPDAAAVGVPGPGPRPAAGPAGVRRPRRPAGEPGPGDDLGAGGGRPGDRGGGQQLLRRRGRDSLDHRGDAL